MYTQIYCYDRHASRKFWRKVTVLNFKYLEITGLSAEILSTSEYLISTLTTLVKSIVNTWERSELTLRECISL